MSPPLDPRMLRIDAAGHNAGSAEPDDPEAAAQAVILANEMLDLRTEKKQLTDRLKAVNRRYNAVRKDELPEAMHRAGMVAPDGRAMLTTESGGKIHLQSDLHVSLSAADRELFHDHLRQSGDADLIVETVHYGTMRAWVKEQLADSRVIPDVLNVHMYLKAVARGG